MALPCYSVLNIGWDWSLYSEREKESHEKTKKDNDAKVNDISARLQEEKEKTKKLTEELEIVKSDLEKAKEDVRKQKEGEKSEVYLFLTLKVHVVCYIVWIMWDHNAGDLLFELTLAVKEQLFWIRI